MHIANAIVERRRINRCMLFFLAGALAFSGTAIHDWTVSAMILFS
jgi:hypothetical protein